MAHFGHDMARRVDPNGEARVWCRHCSGYARRRLEPKLMNRCSADKNNKKVYGVTLKIIPTFEKERSQTGKFSRRRRNEESHEDGVREVEGAI